VFGLNVAELLTRDLGGLVETIGRTIGARLLGSDEDAAAASRLAEEKLTKLLARTILLIPAGSMVCCSLC
jgi:hypothetical protein